MPCGPPVNASQFSSTAEIMAAVPSVAMAT